jgi:hypothetical protein
LAVPAFRAFLATATSPLSALMSRWWLFTSALMPATAFLCFFSARRSRASPCAARVNDWCAAAMSLAAGGVVAFRLSNLADVLAFFVAFRLPDLAAGRVVAFRLPDLADVLAFFGAFRLPDLAAGRVVTLRLRDLAAGRVVAFRLPDLADVPVFFVAFGRLLLSRRSVRLVLGGPLAVVAYCSHPAPRLNSPGRGRCSGRHATLGCGRRRREDPFLDDAIAVRPSP